MVELIYIKVSLRLLILMRLSYISILLNIMFHASMGRFQLELIYHFSTPVSSNSCAFLSCRPFVVNTTFLTGLVDVEVSSVSCPERPTGKKHTTVGWDDCGKIGKVIN